MHLGTLDFELHHRAFWFCSYILFEVRIRIFCIDIFIYTYIYLFFNICIYIRIYVPFVNLRTVHQLV